MKRTFGSILAFLCFSVSAQTQWTTSGNNIYNTNSGNVGIKTAAPVYPIQMWDGGTNPYSGIGFFPGNNATENAIIKSLKTGNHGMIIRAENQDFGKGQAGIYLRPHDGISTPSQVYLLGNQIEFRTGMGYSDIIHDGNIGTSAVLITNDQKVGIGMGSPSERLTVNGNILLGDFTTGFGNSGAATSFKMNDRFALQATTNVNNDWTRGIIGQNIIWNNTTSKWDIGGPYSDFSVIKMETNGNMGFYTNVVTNNGYSVTETDLKQYLRMWITGDGRVSIGNLNPNGYKLAVDGKIGARGIKVTLGTPWADYVFNSDYKLMSLVSLEEFIKKNNHLPNIPSAEEVKKEEGIDLGDMNVKLLEKIEELTLHMIEMNKKMEETNKRISALEKENSELKKK
jgi:hypothetical protein